jgi:hypothetical protein
MDREIQIGNPGYFVLPDGKIPILRLKVRRNPQGQIQELIIDFDPSLKVQARLKSYKSIPLQFRGTARAGNHPLRRQGMDRDRIAFIKPKTNGRFELASGGGLLCDSQKAYYPVYAKRD